MDYCIKTWDPGKKGIAEEPHLNTYDIELWGPDGMNTSFYLGALNAMSKMGQLVEDNVKSYQTLYRKGKLFMENELYDGEYFVQKVRWTGLKSPDPVELSKASLLNGHSDDDLELWQREGPEFRRRPCTSAKGRSKIPIRNGMFIRWSAWVLDFQGMWIN